MDARFSRRGRTAPRHYMNSFGQDRVMFGTDWPVVDPDRAKSDVAAMA